MAGDGGSPTGRAGSRASDSAASRQELAAPEVPTPRAGPPDGPAGTNVGRPRRSPTPGAGRRSHRGRGSRSRRRPQPPAITAHGNGHERQRPAERLPTRRAAGRVPDRRPADTTRPAPGFRELTEQREDGRVHELALDCFSAGTPVVTGGTPAAAQPAWRSRPALTKTLRAPPVAIPATGGSARTGATHHGRTSARARRRPEAPCSPVPHPR